MSDENTNYADDIKIDPEALDVEWTRQASLMFRYATMLAEARDHVDRSKESLEVYEAELGLKVRRNPEKYGFTKITESVVSTVIETDSGRRKLHSRLLDDQREYELLLAAVRALDQKKAALEGLVKLQGQNYFAGPKVPRDIGEEWVRQAEHKSARDRVKKIMNKQR